MPVCTGSCRPSTAWAELVLLRRRRQPPPPIPPAALPPGHALLLEGTGETFYRDSGPETARLGTLLLLHGWTVTADLNWIFAYNPLVAAGYRVIAPDHRGHGRGLRPQVKFRLEDCAADAAQLVRQLEAGPVTAVGYSMGGAIAQLAARDHADVVDSVVLCATALNWSSLRDRAAWFGMRAFQWILRMFSHRFWRGLLRRAGRPNPSRDSWMLSEFSRGSPDDIAEAGRELGRFDSRPWIAAVRQPVSVVITTEDQLIPAARQFEIAAHIPGATTYEVAGDHDGTILEDGPVFAVILRAVADVRGRRQLSASAPALPAQAPAGSRSPRRPEIA
jgi:pimeloyl-ACP methyl ester carboxylesterase